MGLKLGVTGGIGSGKTSVCRIFSVLGIPVFSADSSARDIMDSQKDVIDSVNSAAGKDLYPFGTLDRAELARMIFSDEKLLAKINSIVHPLVQMKFLEWEKTIRAPYSILESAIMFESGASELVDNILTVIAPENERIERVVRRNNLTREQVIERIRNQSTDEFKVSRSDYIVNNADNEMIVPVILNIHRELMELSGKNRQ